MTSGSGRPLNFENIIRQGANLWRQYNTYLDKLEKLAEQDPEGAVRTALLFVRDKRSQLHSDLRDRFGIEVLRTHPQPSTCVVDEERARPQTLLELAERWDALQNYLVFDAAYWVMCFAISTADERGVSPDKAGLADFFYIIRNSPAAYAPLARNAPGGKGPQSQQRLQEATLGGLSAWVRSQIKKYPSLREALAKEGDPEEVLLRELPGALMAELSELEAAREDPDKLVALLEKLGKRGVYKVPINRVTGSLRRPERGGGQTGPGQPPEDLALLSFAEREALLKKGRDVGLPPREYQYLKLIAQNLRITYSEAARILGVAVGTAKKLKHNLLKSLEAA